MMDRVGDRRREKGADVADLDFTGRRILVTGGLGALGGAIAARLRGLGATVGVNDVTPGDDPLLIPGDAADEGVPAAVLDAFEASTGGRADTLCLNAGTVVSASILETSTADLVRVHRTNVVAAVALAQEASRRWVAAGEGGLLLFTGSWVSGTPWPGIAAYRASKAALVAYATSFARELAPHGIRANVIEPGIVGAGMALHQWNTEPDYRARAGRAVPLGSLQTPSSVADAFAVAASPLLGYATGMVLTVDGGASLYPMD